MLRKLWKAISTSIILTFLSIPTLGQTADPDTAMIQQIITPIDMVSIDSLLIRKQFVNEEIKNKIHNILQDYYEEFGFEEGTKITVGLDSENYKIAIQDVVGPKDIVPLDNYISSSQQSSSRSISNSQVLINSQWVGDGEELSMNSCDITHITGNAEAAFIGHITSRVSLLKDGDLVTSDTKYREWFSLGQGHQFTLESRLESGNYVVNHDVLLFGQSVGSGSVGVDFIVENSALCNKSVLYRAHLQHVAWHGWTRDGGSAGTTGEHRRMEAVEIKLVGDSVPGMRICYSVHARRLNWMAEVCDGETGGTTGEGRRLEAIKVRLVNAPVGCSVEYRVHMKGSGWGPWKTNGVEAGSTGKNKRIEDINVRLVGNCT